MGAPKFFVGIDHGSESRAASSLFTTDADGRLVSIGPLRSLEPSGPVKAPSPILALDLHGYRVPQQTTYEVGITRSLVNWPLLADLVEQTDPAAAAEMRAQPNEFGDETPTHFLVPGMNYLIVHRGQEIEATFLRIEGAVKPEYVFEFWSKEVNVSFDAVITPMAQPNEVVFYVSDGDAVCVDCYSNLPAREGYCPVRRDGDGDDGCGLICACGISASRAADGLLHVDYPGLPTVKEGEDE